MSRRAQARQARSLAGVVLFVLAAAACKDDATPDCSQVPAKCDITQGACQRAVLAITACERGYQGTLKPPPTRVITAEQFGSELRAESDNTMADTRWDAGFAALGLLPAMISFVDAEIAVSVAEVAAYYDPDARRVSIIRSALDSDEVSNMYVLSHELTHYLQDLDFDLHEFDAKHQGSSDEYLAADSLVEGEAVVNSTRVLARMNHRNPDELDWNLFGSMLEDLLPQALQNSDAPLPATVLQIPYIVGTPYVGNVWRLHDHERVDKLFDSPPKSIVDMRTAGLGKSVLQPLDCGLPDAPEGFQRAAVDSLGFVGLVALAQVVAGNPNLDAADSVRGDVVGIYPSNDDGGPEGVIAWRIRFDNDELAQSVARTAAEKLSVATLVTGPEVLLTTSRNPSENPLTGSALQGCPAPTPPDPGTDSAKTALLLRLLPHSPVRFQSQSWQPWSSKSAASSSEPGATR